MACTPSELLALARWCARRYSVPGYGADDLAQEATVVMLAAGPGASPQRLRDVARTHLSNLYRSATRRPRVTAHADMDAIARGFGVDREAEAWEAAEAWWLDLTPRQRDVVERGAVDGQNDDTIAAELHTSVAVVQVLRSRAKAKLEGRGHE